MKKIKKNHTHSIIIILCVSACCIFVLHFFCKCAVVVADLRMVIRADAIFVNKNTKIRIFRRVSDEYADF